MGGGGGRSLGEWEHNNNVRAALPRKAYRKSQKLFLFVARGPNGPDITHLGILPQSIKVLQQMVHGITLQIFMQSPGVLDTISWRFSYILLL